jgi:mRNA-degrading endonuclease RelE of RelBE toxin-antitoxin system
MPKVYHSCKKVLEKLEKTKPKITRQIAKKLNDFHTENKGKYGYLGSHGKCNAYKIYLTTPFGAFRLICIDNALVDIVLLDVYAKSDKDDLTVEEYKKLKQILADCQGDKFWSELLDF